MNARSLLSLLAALAAPVMVSAQAPDHPAPDSPPPPPADHRDAPPPPQSRDSGPSHDRPRHGWDGYHRHRAKQDDGKFRGPGRDGSPFAEARERFGHLKEAMQHLRAAGLNEEAEHVEMQMHKMRDEMMAKMHEAREHARSGPHDGQGPQSFAAPEGPGDLRAKLQHIMKEVHELRKEMEGMQGGREGHRMQGPPMRPEGHHGDRRPPPGPSSKEDAPPGPDHHDGMPPHAAAPGSHPDHPPFPRPEWREHKDGNGEHHRGDHHANADAPPAPAPMPEGGAHPGPHEGASDALEDLFAPPLK